MFVWLGSDNNRGQPTAWKQGIRALGKISKLEKGEKFNDESSIEIEVLAVFSHSIDQYDFLDKAASLYKHFSKYPVIGVRSSRNNAIQKVNEGDQQNSSALLTAVCILVPDVKSQIEKHAPELSELTNFVPVGDIGVSTSITEAVPDTDDVWKWVSYEVFHKHERNFLFLGVPGTGKTWYANEVAKKLSEGDPERQCFVQFHPSFSYDDFVEGYTPKLSKDGSAVEYSLEDKHFLNICSKAKNDGGNIYVIVIDELSRGDPSRIFGELMTYLETSHRNREFSLAYSGERTFVPANVVLIATANPYDRSVGELDDALIRRFVMREFPPDIELLGNRLKECGADENFRQKLLHVFQRINEALPNGFGHAHLWNVQNEDDFKTLWQSRIRFLLNRALMFDETSLDALQKEVEEVFSQPVAEVTGEIDPEDVEAVSDENGQDNVTPQADETEQTN